MAQILIVEDEGLIAEDLRRRLVHMQYDVLGITDSGDEAVELTEALHPDLVLMDVSLRGSMDGFEAGQEIEGHYGCPVVYLTSNPRARSKPYWVPKPFTTVVLAAVIAKALASRVNGHTA